MRKKNQYYRGSTSIIIRAVFVEKFLASWYEENRTLKNRRQPSMKRSRMFSPEALATMSSVPWCCIIFDVLLVGTVSVSFIGVFMRSVAHIMIPFAYTMLVISIIRFIRNQHWKSRGQTILLICTAGIVLFSTALHFFVWHFH